MLRPALAAAEQPVGGEGGKIRSLALELQLNLASHLHLLPIPGIRYAAIAHRGSRLPPASTVAVTKISHCNRKSSAVRRE
ncbi:hypothetical protein AwMethylo_01440 [Methylobacterium sp.]|nr:hypothetical protein AwMethylo_01440 [Methylobacterium sp.]